MEIKKEELVTLLVPVYNTEKYIKKCLESIVNQTYKNLEIILIDDGSNDNSGKICDEYAKKDSRIEVFHKENQGSSAEKNFGLSIAKGRYISFIDSDDYLEPTLIEKLVKSIEINQSDIAICNFFPNSTTDLEETFTASQALTYIMNKRYFRGYNWNKLYKTEIAKDIQFCTDIYMSEDLLFNCNYLLKAKKCSYIDEKLYHYNENNNSISNSKLSKKYLTIIDSYDRLVNLYKENKLEYLPHLYIDEFKVCCDIIYKNSLIKDKKDKLDLKKVYDKKKELFNKITKSKCIKFNKKIEVCIYGLMPIFVGKLRKIKKNMHK